MQLEARGTPALLLSRWHRPDPTGQEARSDRPASVMRVIATAGCDRSAPASRTTPFALGRADPEVVHWRRSATPLLGLVSRRPRGQQADGGAVGAEAKAPTALQIHAAADKCQQRCGHDLRLPLADRRAEARRARKSTGLPLLIETSKRRGVCGRSDRECQQAGARRRAEEPAHSVRDRAEPGSRGIVTLAVAARAIAARPGPLTQRRVGQLAGVWVQAALSVWVVRLSEGMNAVSVIESDGAVTVRCCVRRGR
jgi:hypothetical protein